MKAITTFKDFLKTYSKKTQERVRLYSKVMRLRNRYGYGGKKIAKILSISRYKIEGWIYQKTVPRPIKALKVLNDFGLGLPLFISKTDEFVLFLKIFAFVFGDGGIGRSFRVYLTGDKGDLEELEKEIENTFFFKCKINEVTSKNSKIGNRLIRGKSFELSVQGTGSYIFGRLLNAAGAPAGDKVITPFLIPDWITDGPKWVKKLFLEVLLANEIQTPKLKKGKQYFGNIYFGMVKTAELKENLRKFLLQFKRILNEFNIKTGDVKFSLPRKERKDGKITYPTGFYIQANRDNILKFYRQFKFLYAFEKQRIFEDAIKNYY